MAPVEVIDLTLPSPEQVRSSFTRPLSNGKRSMSSPSSSETTNHKKHKRGAKRKRRPTSQEPNIPKAETKDNDDELFFVDLTPSEHPPTSQAVHPITTSQQKNLLLPQHVTILTGTPVELEVQPLSDEDDDFINYVDYEDAKDVVRYFHQSSDETASVNRVVCKNCGEEGLHKTSACRIQICLTCGARDEHSTRSCPISKICFTCGMKGHIIANCPNRRTSRAMLSEHECNRCSAPTHKTNECPTWWRLYEYFSGEDRNQILAMRQQRKDMKLGEGGEGYVADDEWCYNCGNAGHWGDDCDTLRHTFESEEHSAFSKANAMKGPFYDLHNHQPTTTKSRVRDWEQVDRLSVMADVGRKGRLKSKVALERRAREIEHDDDGDDWFAKGNRQKNRSTIRSPHQQTPSKKFSFDRHDDRYAPDRRSKPPSLLDRIQIQPPAREDSGSKRSHARDPRFDKSNLAERNRPRSDRWRDSGPRYRGGYGK